MDKEAITIESKKTNFEDNKRIIKESELSGIVVIFDLTNSTDLKIQRGFPGWVNDLEKFHEIVTQTMLGFEGKWNKFLGDAYLFFYHTGKKGKVPSDISVKGTDYVLNACIETMNRFWEFYSIYKEREKGEEKDKNFREMTCAIDMGNEIINWRQIIDDNVEKFDPIGTPIDRCFRISKIAGPSQLLISKDFYENLCDENKHRFLRIHIKEDTLKGFKNEDTVYYYRPSQNIINYILDDKSVELIENSKPMVVKAKIKLLREHKNDITKQE